jgi:hypothetical protein
MSRKPTTTDGARPYRAMSHHVARTKVVDVAAMQQSRLSSVSELRRRTASIE